MSNLSNRIKSELEVISGSDKNNNYYKFIEEVNDIIAKYPEESVKVGIDLILKSWHWKPWSNISLEDDQFDSIYHRHNRCWFIQKDKRGIHNVLAYTLKQRRIYLKTKDGIHEIEDGCLSKEGEILNEKVYISRGGIINGDYIYKCYLTHQIGSYNVKDPVKLPVSAIEDDNSPDIKFFVDHREPKLKALMEFYVVPIERDYNVKFNVRTFKKLK